MGDSNTDVSSNPGLILRAAREELAYTIDHVANELHLRSSVVQSLEDEDYDSFKNDVFLKGYFRSYCRLVNLHEGRMVELLDAQLVVRKKHQRSLDQEAKSAKQARRNKKILSLAVGAVALIVIVLMVGKIVFSEDTEQSTPALNVEVPAEKIADYGQSSEPVASNESAVVLSQEAATQENEPKELSPTQTDNPLPAEMETSQDEESRSQADASTEPEASTAETAQVETSPEENQVEPQAVEELGGDFESVGVQAEFFAEFSGDCWFTLKDISGKTIFADLKRVGQVVSYSGLAPFHIVLGDARVASIKFNGEEVDLKPYTRRNGRAELSLGKE